MMLTTSPGPLYPSAIVWAPHNTLNARMNRTGSTARPTDASCAWPATRSCSSATLGGAGPGGWFSILESECTTCRHGKPRGPPMRCRRDPRERRSSPRAPNQDESRLDRAPRRGAALRRESARRWWRSLSPCSLLLAHRPDILSPWAGPPRHRRTMGETDRHPVLVRGSEWSVSDPPVVRARHP